MGITFRVASGRHDLEAVANLWNQRYSRSTTALSRFTTLIQTGSLIVTEEAESARVLGAVPLDFLSVDNGLLVAFNLTDGDDNGSVLRQQIHLVLQAAIFSAIGRVICYDDGTEHCRGLIWDEFNALSPEERLHMSLEIAGAVEDYLRDNRDAAPNSLFIRSAERPDLSRQAQPIADAVQRTARDLSLSNPPQFLNIAGRRIENKDRVKDMSKEGKEENVDKEQRESEKFDKDEADGIKDQEKTDQDKNAYDKDSGEKNVADKPDKDIKDKEYDKNDYDKNSADKQASEKQKEKEQTEKDPVSEKPETEKDPTEKDPTENLKEQSDKDEDGTGEPEGRQRFLGPELQPNLLGTRQAIIYRELGISLPASLIELDRMVEV